MKVFIDTEFCQKESKGTLQTELISLGAVSDSGHTFYAENNAVDLHLLPKWHQDHIIPNLPFLNPSSCITPLRLSGSNSLSPGTHLRFRKKHDWNYGDLHFIAGHFKHWLRHLLENGAIRIKFVGYGAETDWSLVSFLLRMVGEDANRSIIWGMFDILPFLEANEINERPKREQPAHFALSDAKWHRDIFQMFRQKEIDFFTAGANCYG